MILPLTQKQGPRVYSGNHTVSEARLPGVSSKSHLYFLATELWESHLISLLSLLICKIGMMMIQLLCRVAVEVFTIFLLAYS